MSTMRIRIAVSLAMLILAVLHSWRPAFLPPDRITLTLLILAALPWAAAFAGRAELPGGWAVKFRQMEEKQRQQEEKQRQQDDSQRSLWQELQSVRFVVSHSLTAREWEYLRMLGSGQELRYHKQDALCSELLRLSALGLIASVPGRSLEALPAEGDLREYFTLTEQGRSLVEELNPRAAVGREGPGVGPHAPSRA